MQPITYSLVINLATLAAVGVLAYTFAQPMLIILAIVLQSHALERFRDEQPQMMMPDEDDESQPMGFTADIR